MSLNQQTMLLPLLLLNMLLPVEVSAYRPLYAVKSLYDTVLTGYDTRIRPRLNQSQTVDVASQFVPNNIIEFDTTEQRFSILGSIRVSWTDEVLQWNPADYWSTNSIKVPLSELWKPSLILLKAFDGDGVVGDSDSDIANVQSNGLVEWQPEGIFSFVCEVDIQYYPFDEQNCMLSYYVSDETVTTVNLAHDSIVDASEFLENSEWNLVDIRQTKTNRYNTNFIEVHFTVQRRANFATFTMIIPLLMLAFLNVCVFLVPIDSGEKGSFSITIFLSYGIFVSIVSDTLPHNSLQISYFVLFLIVLLLLSVMSVFYTIMQAKLFAAYGEEECKVGFCIKKNKVEPKEGEHSEGLQDLEDETDRNAVPNVPSKKKEAGGDAMKANGVGGEDEGDDNVKDEDVFTWRKFLERLDTFLFVVFFLLIAVASTIFFCLMMQRLGVDKFQNVNV